MVVVLYLIVYRSYVWMMVVELQKRVSSIEQNISKTAESSIITAIILYNRAEGKTKCKIEAGEHSPIPTSVPVSVVTSLYVEGTMKHKASSDKSDDNFNTWSKKAGK